LNLNHVAAAIVSAITPKQLVSIQLSTGATTQANLTRTPTYEDPVSVLCNIQALSQGDLRQLDGVNLQGSHRAIYIDGAIQGTSRPYLKGGDLVTMADGSTWLVTKNAEPWFGVAGWTHAIITLQNDTNLGS
jgi:hypothetical protein